MTSTYRIRPILLIISLIALILLALNARDIFINQSSYPEVVYLKNQTWSFAELSHFFANLAEEKGAAYAYQVLKVTPLPLNTDLHLLGHVVGDVLYKERGADGMTICTQDFRNACSHSIVVGLFTDKGPTALPEITEACKSAPGGSGAYSMCFHGLGHGILAYAGYDMSKAVTLCKKTVTRDSGDRESIECIGGTVMEIIGGGFHDRTLWEEQSKKYLSSSDPLSLCNSEFIPPSAKPQCYIYLTPHLFNVAGKDASYPERPNIGKAFTFCDRLPISDMSNRSACFGGFGKEFVVLAQDRDIRRIDQMTAEQFKTVYDWCTLAADTDGIRYCLNYAVNSIFWGGENDAAASLKFCNSIPETSYQDSCFNNLIGAVAFFKKEFNYLQGFCKRLPQKYSNACHSRIN